MGFSGRREAVHHTLKRFLRVGKESAIICILTFSHQRPRAFGAGLEASKVVERAIHPRADVYTFLRCVFKGICEQSSRKEGEECGSKYIKPCFTPLLYCMSRVNSPFTEILTHILVCSSFKILTNFGGQPIFSTIIHSASQFTRSNALVKSTNVMYRFWFCSLDFSMSCRRAKIISVVPRLRRKPH